MKTPDPYAVLGVASSATQEEIKTAYRRLSKENHPDRAGPNAHARQAELNAAYHVLGDVERRAEYDRPLLGVLLSVADQAIDGVAASAHSKLHRSVPVSWGKFGEALRNSGGAVVKAAAQELRDRAARGVGR